MSGYFDVGEFSVADFSPVSMEPSDVPLDEMDEKRLRNYLVELRVKCLHERSWQQANGVTDKSRLIRLAEMYREVQNYYAEYDPQLKARINSRDYVPVLRLDGRSW